MKKRLNNSGMSLIELMIVIGILGVLFAAVYMFFVKGTEQFNFARRQNELATTGRLALEAITDEIRYAGYMPHGGWTEDLWHPIEVAEDTTLKFYADLDGNGLLSDTDYRNIFGDSSMNVARITDEGSMNRIVGDQIVEVSFNYYNAQGTLLSEPLNASDRDAVRHIGVKLTLQDTYMGDVYQTVMQTVVTPMNLGVIHNFDPLFYLPPETPGRIIENIADSITADQDSLYDNLIMWGHDVILLTDSELLSFDFDSIAIDLVILRDMTGPSYHSTMVPFLQSLPVPILVMDADDAVHVFNMAANSYNVTSSLCPMEKVIVNHDIHRQVPVSDPDLLTFNIYDGTDPASIVTVLDSLRTGVNVKLVTAFTGTGADTLSGVSVINDEFPASRRIHYCAPSVSNNSVDGDWFLYWVIIWGLGTAGSTPPLGDEITLETFEGDSPGELELTLWEDDLEGGMMLPDSTPIYTDFITGGTADMVWNNISTGSGQITRLVDNTLETDRLVSGAFDRNIAATSADLSAYSAFTDDIYITVDSWRGNTETINAEDGVFLFSSSGSVTDLVSEDFETLALGNGDVEFWGDLYGRHRVHSPGWNNGTSFATLDKRINGSDYGRSRMMIEVDTSTLSDGTPITVYFRMSDHGDENHAFNSSTKSGDYVGWSLGNDITDDIEDYMLLSPQSYTNGQWYDREYTFTPSGSMPSTLYIIFSQYDNYTATSAIATDGISFDDILIVADNASLTLDRVGVPSSSADWQRIGVDLDDQAIAYGIPFSANFGIALSQYGLGPWNTYGMHWRDFEIGVINEIYSLPGWDHGPVVTGGIDDWLLENVGGDHRWTTHANNPANYSNNSDCWLETPEFSIPAGATDAQLSFIHQFFFEAGADYCWIEVSTNGGATWQPFETPEYNATYNGHGAFTGSIVTQEIVLDLTGQVGQSVKFRFLIHSGVSVTNNGWSLDDFKATCVIQGLSIQSIGFKPVTPGGSWLFDTVDIWLGGVTADVFSGSGEWNKGELTFAGTYAIPPNPSGDWVEVNLADDFILPDGTNLLVKLEMNQAGPISGYQWVAESVSDMTRWATSSTGDPTNLAVADVKPAFMVTLLDHGSRYVFDSGAATSTVMPLAFNSLYGDFEAIYTLEELGFSGDVSWVHGGEKDDWEIGAPIFTPDVDPDLLTSNENSIAGNDLTDDGYYPPMAWNWIRSCPYDLSEAAAYDTVSLSYDRCLRRSFNDFARIQMAFTVTSTPPTDEADWITIQECNYDDTNWENHVLNLTSYFEQAVSDGKNYFFVRFLLDSGVFAEKGGWNIDNVGFYGRNAI